MIHVAHASYSYVEPSGHEDEYQSLETGRIASRNMEVGMIFLLQTVAGILRNFSLLYHYIFLHFTGCKLRSRIPFSNTRL